MISDYEGESIPLEIEPEMVSVSVQNDSKFSHDSGIFCEDIKDAAVQTDALRELIIQEMKNAGAQTIIQDKKNMSVQTDEDEDLKKLKALNRTLLDAVELAETKKVKKAKTDAQVQTKKKVNTALAQDSPSISGANNLFRDMDIFRREMQHLYTIMKCEQHILDLRFSILEHRHEIVDDRVEGIFKYIPEAMAYINPRAKRLSMFGAIKHFLRQSVYGSLLVAILSVSTLYTTMMNIIKYPYI